MRILGTLAALAFAAVSVQASSISFGTSSRGGYSRTVTMAGRSSGRDIKNGSGENREGEQKSEENNDYSNAWSELPGRDGKSPDGVFLKGDYSVNWGLDVNFQYAHGDGEDGFSFLLLDSKKSDESGRQESILGVEFNRRVLTTGGEKEGEGQQTTIEDIISLRGPGDGTTNPFTGSEFENYALIATTASDGPRSMKVDEGWKSMKEKRGGETRDTEVIMDTTQIGDRKLPVTVWMKDDDGQDVIVARYDAYNEVRDYYGGDSNIPQSFRIGFSGSTGGGASLTTMTSSLTVTDPGAVPEPSTLMLGLGGLMVSATAAWKKRRQLPRQ